MHVLVADTFEKSGLSGLEALGCVVSYEPTLVDDALAGALRAGGAEVLVVRSTRVTDGMMAPTLKLIVRAGAGVNTIDVKAATAHGVVVANCPGKNATAVAELAFGLMLALDRRIYENVADLRAGIWNKKAYARARGLHGSTLGLLGLGGIGTEMIRRAAAFGMPVVAWSRRFDGQDRPLPAAEVAAWGVASPPAVVSVAPSAADVAARSDILSIHLALAPETRHLVNADVLARLKPGGMLINTARGEILDEAALTEAIRDRRLRVGLDVYAQEPAEATGAFTDPIVHQPGVYGTHHIGASTDQAQEAIAAETVRIVRTFIDTGRAANAVN